jgi:hypothetical protein
MKCLIFNNLSTSYSYKKNKCRCRACKEWKKDAGERTNDKELAKERSKIWRLNNLERSRNNSKSYQKRFPRKVLEWKLKKYNMTLEDFDLMLTKQNGVCKICGKGYLMGGTRKLLRGHYNPTNWTRKQVNLQWAVIPGKSGRYKVCVKCKRSLKKSAVKKSAK